MSQKVRIGIIGATGYVGMELVRALFSHPNFTLSRLVSKSYVGKKYSDVYPSFKNLVDITCTDVNVEDLSENCDIVITALPHGVSSEIVPKLLKKGLRVLDHSGDFRYKDVTVYEEAYKLKHPSPSLLKEATYGLPEIYREEIKNANLVSNPGCYPTCSILAINPLLQNNLILNSSIIIDATSGISGAGRKADEVFSFCESNSSYRPYSPVGHRHTSEIEHILSLNLDSAIKLSFTPHLAPISRGMVATVYATLKNDISIKQLHDVFVNFYKNEFFVRVLDEGVCPDTKNVAYTNFADINVFIDKHTNRVVVFSAIDNLGKGAALQAVQSLNIMAGLPEATGLIFTGGGI